MDEKYTVEKFYTGFYIFSHVKEIEMEKYNFFLNNTFHRMGFLTFNRAVDVGLIGNAHRETIEERGIQILSNPSCLTGACLMGLILEALEDDKKPSDELISVMKTWMKNYASAEGKGLKDYDCFIDLLNNSLNKDLSELQLRFITSIVELGYSNLKNLENEILSDAERELKNRENAAKGSLVSLQKNRPYNRRIHQRAIINTALAVGLNSPVLAAALMVFRSIASMTKNFVGGRIF